MLESWGVEFLDLPAKSAEACGVAYFKYASNRKASGPTPAPRIPLPDFFIGAHAAVLGGEGAEGARPQVCIEMASPSAASG